MWDATQCKYRHQRATIHSILHPLFLSSTLAIRYGCCLPQHFLSSVGPEKGTVSLGKKHTLILSYDGELYACGCNAEGQLGSKAAQPDTTQPVDVPVRLSLQLDEARNQGVHNSAWF
jgi:hypothetical protein